MIAEVPFGPFMPDAPDYKNPGLELAQNVYPVPGGYAPFLVAVGSGYSVTGETRGAYSFKRDDGTVVRVIGTASDIYTIIGGTVTASSLSATLPDSEFWEFKRYNNILIAVTPSEVPRYMADMQANTTMTTLPGSPPKARTVNRVGDFVMFGDLTDIDASTARARIRWSQFNNPAGTYGDDIATQSGAVDMDPAFGPVVSIAGGRYDVILQERGVSRIAYVGGQAVFAKETVSEERGCIAAPSVASVGSAIYFLSQDGFCRTDGASVEVISQGRVWEWFRDNSDDSERGQTQAAVDWQRRCVIWNFVSATSGQKDQQLIYSWAQNAWSTSTQSVEWFFDSTKTGISIEALDAIYGDLDSIPVSLDSPELRSKGRNLAGVVDSEFVEFVGDSAEATFMTGDFQPMPGKRTFVDMITPLINNADMNTRAAIGWRNIHGQAVQYATEAAQGARGFIPARVDALLLRARISIPAGAEWTQATGFQVNARASASQ